MKFFVFVRGVDTPLKRQTIETVMQILNPDLNNVRAIRLDMMNYVNKFDVSGSIKAADKTCKNQVKQILRGHQESHLVITNESLIPVHWQSYMNLTQDVAPDTVALGIDVYDENFHNEEIDTKKNLQEQNMHVFNATMHKYVCIKKNEDLVSLNSWLLQDITNGE